MASWKWIGSVACGALLACAGGAPDDGGDIAAPGQIEQSVSEGAANPPSQVIQVGNRGNCALELTAEATNASPAFLSDGGAAPVWLTVTPAGATVNPGTQVPLTIGFLTAGLVPGNYVGSILLAGLCAVTQQTARGSPRLVSVNLTVTPVGASITVDDSTVTVDVSPVANQWQSMAANGLYAGRSQHNAIWTGREMWVFGGVDSSGNTVGVGGRYEPLIDDWSNMASGPDSPSARCEHTAVWTGTEMIVFGGMTDCASGASTVNTGARYNGATWTPTSAIDAPGERSQHTAVWTGREMIVFGGLNASNNPVGNGGRYNPVTNTWRDLAPQDAPSARAGHSAVWTGRYMLIWGGFRTAAYATDGARYDPVTDEWTAIAAGGPERRYLVSAWTGSRWILYGGETSGALTAADGKMYLPGSDTWIDITPDTQRRNDLTASAWTGGELLVWGGGTGRRFHPNTNTWSNVAPYGPMGVRQAHSAVWTGTSMILWGGTVGLGDGAIYR